MKTITLTDAEYDRAIEAIQARRRGPADEWVDLLAVFQGTWVDPQEPYAIHHRQVVEAHQRQT